MSPHEPFFMQYSKIYFGTFFIYILIFKCVYQTCGGY